MANIGGFGLQVTLRADKTFPLGVTLSSFADDADPLDLPTHKLADAAMGLNGDLITWSKATPLMLDINVIPDSDDDNNLQVIAEANRVGKGKQPVGDVLTLIITYPDGKLRTYTGGRLTDANLGNSVASSARFKTKPYKMVFENVIG